MKIISDPGRMQRLCRSLKRNGSTIGFVPTMGALHEGHLSLIRRSKKENRFTCVSIFVNPAQFGPSEDFARYPRPRRVDTALCKKENVDFLFAPGVKQMYGENFRAYIEVKGLGDVLCGASRRGHFRGVATVVAKLFNIIQPDTAYFGQKDFQQTVVLRRMAADLNFPVQIRVLPTIREKQGLAKSSRNSYLSAEERSDALVLSRALAMAAKMVKAGERGSGVIIRRMKQMIRSCRRVNLEYLEIVDTETLAPVKAIAGCAAVVVAARVGATRLIDNIRVKIC
jgi:pantoate--beta-alanine ligase